MQNQRTQTCIILNANRRTQNGGSLGTRLYVCHECNCSNRLITLLT